MSLEVYVIVIGGLCNSRTLLLLRTMPSRRPQKGHHWGCTTALLILCMPGVIRVHFRVLFVSDTVELHLDLLT